MNHRTTVVRATVADRIAIMTLDQPPVNALSRALLAELNQVLAEAALDPAIRVVVLTGLGRMFCAGANLHELASIKTPEEGTRFAREGQRVLERIERMKKPVLAAIDGACVGGGLELALACHVRLASDRARFALPEVKLGLMPGFGGTQRLPRLIGSGRAAELILTGRLISAQEAARIGLVNDVVPAADLLPTATRLAAGIAQQGRHAVAAALEALSCAQDGSPALGAVREADLFGSLFATPDAHEGLAAFLEKRQANFEP